MIKNYLKIAVRALCRNKMHSMINILGLGIGISCCILITLFVHDEFTFDTFHSKVDRIFRVYARENWGENQEFLNTVTPFPMGPAIKENLPEVEAQVRIVKTGTQVKLGDKVFNETLTVGGRDMFDVFDFQVLKGEKGRILDEQNNIVISSWAAEKYFGNGEAIGKTLTVQIGEKFEDFTVSGVTDVPTNSSIQFDLLISDDNLPKLYNEHVLTSAWFNINPETYVLLREGVDPKDVVKKFPTLFRTLLGEEEFRNSNYSPGLQPLKSIHLDTGFPPGIAPVSNPRYAYVLSAVAMLILFVASINFVTLSIGRSLKRAREVGIRKVVGALRFQLITQFVGEALVVTLISIVLGVGLAVLGLPIFNDLSGKQLTFPFNGFMVTVVMALLLIIGVIAGSYPAFILSAFNPIGTLKGGVQGNSRPVVRRALVGVQLVLSIFLLSSTLVMKNQLNFLQNKNLGFDKEHLAVIPLKVTRQGRLPERIEWGFQQAQPLKTELIKMPDVVSVAVSSHDFANGAWTNVGFTDEGGNYRTFNVNIIDEDYLSALNMKILKGRNFEKERASDKRRALIVNEAFAKAFGWSNPVGNTIPGKGFPDHEIIGMVEDFNYTSLYTKVEPLVLVQDARIIFQGIENVNIDNSPMPKLMVKLRPGNMMVAIDQMRTMWDKNMNGEEFTFTFVDDALNAQYRSDQNLGKVVSLATLLAILIGGLGLYGLASLTMQNRIKEISIRKVLGATERSLLIVLSKEYMLLVLFCLLLSVPLTVYVMKNWLETFEYRVSIGVNVFLFAGFATVLITLLAIGYQTIRTAWTQPAETLKYE